MPWDDLFEDLETQLASEWESERHALETETNRLRISRLRLRDRLCGLREHPVVIELTGGEDAAARIRDIGADWCAAEPADGTEIRVIPFGAIAALRTDHGAVLQSTERHTEASALHERMTLGFVLRDLARRRVPVTLSLLGSGTVHGTIDRAGADHLDLAVHDRGEPRRARAVHEFRIIPVSALCALTVSDERYRV